MAKESPSPMSFRLTPEDRRLVETVAAYKNQTVSDFVRSVVIEAANQVFNSEGHDKILKKLEESSARMAEERLESYQRAAEQVGSRRP